MKQLIIIAGSFLITCSLFAQKKIKKKPTVSSSNKAASIVRGKVVYQKYCLTCHQADGGGVPDMNPPLINTSYVLGNKQRLIGIVLNGFNERSEIEGETYSNNMPPHSFLTDQQIADVLTFVRNSFANKATVVSADEVKKIRTVKK